MPWFRNKNRAIDNKGIQISNIKIQISDTIINTFSEVIIKEFIKHGLFHFELSRIPNTMFNPKVFFHVQSWAISILDVPNMGSTAYASINYVDYGLDCLQSKQEIEYLGIEISKIVSEKFISFFGSQTKVTTEHDDNSIFQINICLENCTSQNSWSMQTLQKRDYTISGRITDKLNFYYAEIKNSIDENNISLTSVTNLKEKIQGFAKYIEKYKAFFDMKNRSDAEFLLMQLQTYAVLLENRVKVQESIDISGLQKSIDSMSGTEFEQLCANILLRNGFKNVEITKGSGDQGVDIIASKNDIKYAIQCKCYKEKLGNTSIQEVHAGKSMYKCHVAVVMTNNYFTNGAKSLAEATGVLLWDRDKVIEMLRK